LGKAIPKKKAYKKSYKELILLKEDMINKYEKEISYLKQNIYQDKRDLEIQTDVDNKIYGEILKNNNLVVFHKKLVKKLNQIKLNKFKYIIQIN
jgi:hypothetical protein